MRVTTFVVFLRFIGAAGVGAYLGAAAAGLLAVVTGAPDSGWLTALPVLAILGAALTIATAQLTRHWLMPTMSRRLAWGGIAGAVLAPLAVAVAWLGPLTQVAVPAMLGGAATTAVLWARWFRAAYPVRGAGRRRYTATRAQAAR